MISRSTGLVGSLFTVTAVLCGCACDESLQSSQDQMTNERSSAMFTDLRIGMTNLEVLKQVGEPDLESPEVPIHFYDGPGGGVWMLIYMATNETDVATNQGDLCAVVRADSMEVASEPGGEYVLPEALAGRRFTGLLGHSEASDR